ncbi:hypothetical protein KAH55_05380, partial [bacterium]|nr:hypothetical protein [bacterium]
MKQLLNGHYYQSLLLVLLFCLVQETAAAPVYISNFSSFPAYPYNSASYMQSGRYVGCGPTTGAMMMGYYHHVESMSSSNGLLTNPGTGVNEGLNTAWKLHESQYMDTGANGFGSVLNIESGLENYALSRGYEIKATIHASPTYDPNDTASDWLNGYGPYGDSWLNDGDFWTNSGGWNIDPTKFCDFVAAKLSAGIAIFLTIDTDENRSGDHWVALVGYDRATLRYAFYDTYTTTVKWADIYYCNPPGATKDNSISFLRSVEYIGPIQQNLDPPRNLVALNGYHGAVPLAWSPPTSSASRSIPTIPKFTEVHGEQIDYFETIDAISRQNFGAVLQETPTFDTAQKTSKTITIMPAGFIGYNVYRSTSSSGSYTKIANRISRQYYYDDSAVNG